MVELGRMLRTADPEELTRQVAAWKAAGERVAFVPTMGALHEGHLSLVHRARELAPHVVASVFVNPAQFGPGEDFESYPRDLDGDAAKLESAGCELIFEPEVETIYPPGYSTWIDVEGPSEGFEADQRPGHFRGVATVVYRLFRLVRPDLAVFGEKDAQQLAVVYKLARELATGVEIVGAPIVREDDGLAMSSRNVYLDPEERRAAAVLSRSLRQAEAAIRAGERRAAELIRQVRAELESEPRAEIDYVAVVDAETFRPIETLVGHSVIPIAVRIGRTRLLDNLQIRLGQDL